MKIFAHIKMLGNIRFLLLGIILLSFCCFQGFALSSLGDSNAAYKILNQDANEIIEDVGNDARRKGARDAIRSEDGAHKIDNLINSDEVIGSQVDAHSRVLKTIWRFINFALGFVSLISFVVLLIAGFKMLFGAGDEKAQGEGKAAFVKIVRAVVGIALSWLIVNFIFWMINTLVS